MKLSCQLLCAFVSISFACANQEPLPIFAASDAQVSVLEKEGINYGQAEKIPVLSKGQILSIKEATHIDFGFSKLLNTKNQLLYLTIISSEEQVKVSFYDKEQLVYQTSVWSGHDSGQNPIHNIVDVSQGLAFDRIRMSSQREASLKVIDWGLVEPNALQSLTGTTLIAGLPINLDALPKLIVPRTQNLRIETQATVDTAPKTFRIVQAKKTRTFLISDGSKPRSISVYGLRPNQLTQVVGLDDSVKIESFDTPSFPEALPASLDQMLAAEPKNFRKPDYEVYAWSVLPEVKTIAFANYKVQSQFFARIAFFTEKNGFRGQILSDKELQGKHDWNAHDYSAVGLANFFNALKKSGIKPNKSEMELKDLVLRFGIIKEEGGEFVPLSGSLLSFAFGPDTSDQLRRLLLGHESLHGVFFSIPELQKTTEKEFDAMSEASALFIKDYFAYKTYDLDFRELMINEFMAYLFQQSEETLKSELRTLWLPRMKAKFPAKSKLYVASLPDAIQDLVNSRRLMEAPIYDRIGLRPPELSEYRELP